MTRHETDEEKAAWAAYMRDYRANHPAANRRNNDLAPTARQLEILRIYADPERGGTQEKVAETLGISKSAVHNQLQRLMRRLDVHSPAQAVMKLWVNTNEPAEQDPHTDSDGRLRRTRTTRGQDGAGEAGPRMGETARRASPATNQ